MTRSPEETQAPQCEATSWKGSSHKPYGPGDFNRCVFEEGEHERHQDGFGQVFRTEPKFQILSSRGS